MGGRPRLVAALAATVVVVVAVVLIALHLSSSSTGNSAAPTTSASAATTAPSPTPSSSVPPAPVPPATGAWLGAWVQPTVFTEAGRIAALNAYEADLGHKLTVVHDFHTWTDPFPSAFDEAVAARGSQLLLSWAGTKTTDITAGKYDTMIRERATAVKALGAPVLLRWRWEMDRPNLKAEVGSPQDFIAAWTHIRSIFTEVGATNVGWVWCPLASGFDNGTAPAYYPGDSEVDWICTDSYAPDPRTASLAQVSASFMKFAAEHDKPLMFGEFGTQNPTPGSRSAWLTAGAAWIQANPSIKAAVYFDSDVAKDGRIRHWSLRGTPADLRTMGSIASQPYFNPAG